MKRLIIAFAALAACGLVAVATAGDYHSGTQLVCSDCHTPHWSYSHGYNPGDPTPTKGGTDANDYLLRYGDVNDLCLSCHNNNNNAPDVYGVNTSTFVSGNRNAGGLNGLTTGGHPAPGGTYDEIDGHTLWSTATAPGGTWSDAAGLECIDCHSQHGQNAYMYRNLRYSTSTSTTNAFKTKVLYKVGDGTLGSNDLVNADVFEKNGAGAYSEDDIWYNQPDIHNSRMGAWCAGCHTTFHGAGGSTNMGGTSGGWSTTSAPWHRHPTADVFIGHGATPTRVASLAQYTGHTYKVKVMDAEGKWDNTSTQITPSCFSCHKSHGNQNGFGLIFMTGSSAPTEDGDGVYKDLCRQCHVQGA